ncbi:hypothetical protein V1264_021215 [Littorina saxatilis]|uniref:Uncharacterized protein n=1 Tax=Littorina saxatilis TaxID=31220 RepID=A0AAN9FXA3_9CAEN
MTGKKWYQTFMRRHTEISLRQPEPTSLARAQAINKEAVYRYFDLLEKIIDENGLVGSHIYNMAETGVSTVQKKCQKVLGQKGTHLK